jgi:hypothetical protein
LGGKKESRSVRIKLGKEKSSFSTPPPPSAEETQKFEWSSGTKKTDSSKASQSYSIPYVTY